MSNSANTAVRRGSESSIRWPDLTLPPINLYNAPLLGGYQKDRQPKPKRHS